MRYQAIKGLEVFTVRLQGVPVELNGALLVLQALVCLGQQEAPLAKQEVITVLFVVLAPQCRILLFLVGCQDGVLLVGQISSSIVVLMLFFLLLRRARLFLQHPNASLYIASFEQGLAN